MFHQTWCGDGSRQALDCEPRPKASTDAPKTRHATNSVGRIGAGNSTPFVAYAPHAAGLPYSCRSACIGSTRAARVGEPGRQQAGSHDHEQTCGIRDRIGDVHDLRNGRPGRHGDQERGERGGEYNAGYQPVDDGARRLRQHQLRHLLGRGAERHPHADLLGALLNEV